RSRRRSTVRTPRPADAPAVAAAWRACRWHALLPTAVSVARAARHGNRSPGVCRAATGQVTATLSRSGAKAVSLANFTLLAPALRGTVIVVVAGVVQLVPVRVTWVGAAPLTLTKNERVPLSRYVIVSWWLPALAAESPLTVTELAAPLPMNLTSLPPEQAAQEATRAAPDRVLPGASASTALLGADPPPG